MDRCSRPITDYVNQELARIYGVTGAGQRLRPGIRFRPNSERAGLLGAGLVSRHDVEARRIVADSARPFCDGSSFSASTCRIRRRASTQICRR
jgi:hypothetical protein